jgi:hypothetical protein
MGQEATVLCFLKRDGFVQLSRHPPDVPAITRSNQTQRRQDPALRPVRLVKNDRPAEITRLVRIEVFFQTGV